MKTFVISKENLKLSSLLTLFRITLEYIYINFLIKIWSYSGFKNEPTIWTIIFSWIIFLVFIPIIINLLKNKRSTALILAVLYIFVFIPGTIMIGRQPYKRGFIVFYCIYWILIAVAYYMIPYIHISKPSIQSCYLFTESCTILFSLVVIVVWAFYAHFRITVNVLDVYTIRDEASQYNMPLILSYLLSASRSIIPCLCVYKLARKKYFSFIYLCLIQVISFSIDGLKSALFALVISIICYFYYNENFKKYLITGVLGLNLLAILEKLFIGTCMIVTVFIRRVEFVPSLFNYFYYDYFTQNIPDYFKQTFLKYFGVESEYSIRIPYIIGNFKGSAGEYANNGLFSDAFSNLGALGIVIMPFVLVICLNLFDTCSEKIDTKLIIGAIIANCMTLISSNLSVFLITQGFLITCFVIYFLPEDYHYNETEVKNEKGKFRL